MLTVRRMRYLAWVAIFSLQMGMFVCGAGIDVCHAADAPAHIEASQTNNSSDALPADSTCVAHAAHVFLAFSIHDQSQSDYDTGSINISRPLNLFEFYSLIEHPPRFLRS